MKHRLIALSQNYVTALSAHLRPGAPVRLLAAQGLGRQAVALGLETLELARIHDHAVVTLKLSPDKKKLVSRAESFFTEANKPIEETHHATQTTEGHLSRLKETLGQRTVELAATNRQLKRGVVRRKVAEEAAEKNGQHYKKCLEESLELQKRLRQLTHRVIATQEDERKSISSELRDEIAQTLLGINVRLLSLKQQSQSDAKGLKDEIASTQRLVADSARSVRQFARELGTQPKPRQPPAAPLPASRSFPVIAMAASVGGLKALSVILGGLPADFPAAIAIVMHMAPDHKSLLAEILARRTQLVVKEAHTGDQLCRSCAFIAPPNHHLLVGKNGRLKLSSSHAEKIHFARPSAEPLFASVAKIYKINAIAVVLTGGDGDGSFGVQIIKENGGQVIAQDRPTSENFSMPETSIQTGDVDYILPLEEIAPMLIALVWAGKQLKHGQPATPTELGNTNASEKFTTPPYAAGIKAVMLKQRK